MGATDVNPVEDMKYVVVSGRVLSGLGKGVTASSIGVLLKSAGLQVTSIKIDPYLNSDAGTMSPFEHGEVFVLDDGGEVDLDLGNYERFLDINLQSENNLTTGKIYSKVIEAERRVIILEKQSKSYLISPTQFKIGLKMSQKNLMEINLQMLASLNWEEQ